MGGWVHDDDSTLRKYCRSINDGGKLKEGVCQPKFLADPSHRAKVMVKKVFAMVGSSKKLDEVKTLDALRLKKYTTCYISRHRTDDFASFYANARAPVEHLFGNHSFYHPSWCWSREIDHRMIEVIQKSVE